MTAALGVQLLGAAAPKIFDDLATSGSRCGHGSSSVVLGVSYARPESRKERPITKPTLATSRLLFLSSAPRVVHCDPASLHQMASPRIMTV